jgi:hypothetical protein
MQVCSLKNWSKATSSILFHIFDAPGHGKRFNECFFEGSEHYLTFGGDDFWEAPPPGRREPSEEIAEAFDKLKNEFNVVK